MVTLTLMSRNCPKTKQWTISLMLLYPRYNPKRHIQWPRSRSNFWNDCPKTKQLAMYIWCYFTHIFIQGNLIRHILWPRLRWSWGHRSWSNFSKMGKMPCLGCYFTHWFTLKMVNTGKSRIRVQKVKSLHALFLF